MRARILGSLVLALLPMAAWGGGPAWRLEEVMGAPLRASIHLVESPDPEGRFRARVRVDAGVDLEDLSVRVHPTPEVQLSGDVPGFRGVLAEGLGMVWEFEGVTTTRGGSLPVGVALAVEAADPRDARVAKLRAHLERAPDDAEAEAALARLEVASPARIHRLRFLSTKR